MARPLYDTLYNVYESDPLRLHMPGHKGKAEGLFSDIARIDFTEITPTGNLYTMEGPCAEAEALAAHFACAGDALFFTCGATQGIYTMLCEAVGMGGTLILERGCHKSVYHAMALLDITPHYIYVPQLPGTELSGPVTEELVAEALNRCPQAKAVLLTSPTYYGVVSELAPISALCHRHGKALLVDQAHGAHFPAVGLASAVCQGADLAVVSTHKTWPALGSSSILYVGKDAPFEKARLKTASAIFGTTSPSWPILASIDYARAGLEGHLGDQYRRCSAQVALLRRRINENTAFHALSPQEGLTLDPCRLTVDTLSGGLSGFAAQTLLEKQNIFIEMADQRYLVMIFTCCDTPEDLERFYTALTGLPTAAAVPADQAPAPTAISRVRLRQALFGPRESGTLKDSVGRVCGCFAAPYPPGIPILAPGEEITEKHVAYLQKKSYNIEESVDLVPEPETP